MCAVADTGELEQLWRVERSPTRNHIRRMGDLGLTAPSIFHAGSSIAVEEDLVRSRERFESQVRPVEHGM